MSELQKAIKAYKKAYWVIENIKQEAQAKHPCKPIVVFVFSGEVERRDYWERRVLELARGE